jgi:hypothetical protein
MAKHETEYDFRVYEAGTASTTPVTATAAGSRPASCRYIGRLKSESENPRWLWSALRRIDPIVIE